MAANAPPAARGRGIPLWLKLAYTAWMAVWVPAYWVEFGPSNFLWLCDVANLVVCLALWLESPLLFSAQACGVLLVQIGWAVDVLGRLLLGVHPIGGSEYMFDPTEPVYTRILSSFFHLAMPVLLLWAIARLGYHRRGIYLQTALAWVVLPLSFLVAGAELNLNWVWGPFGKQQDMLAPWLYLLVTMAAYPVLLFLPSHLALRWWAGRWA
jgi:hypothetical protein